MNNNNIGHHEDYTNYWETNMYFLQADHQLITDNWVLEEPFSGADYDDSSSPDGAKSAAIKNIISERKRRKNLNERLFALRAVVPNITKMDKASIIKDAIKYIQELREQERQIQAEITELEISRTIKRNNSFEPVNNHLEMSSSLFRSKKKRIDSGSWRSSSRVVDVIDLSVSNMDQRTVVVNLTCNKKPDTMVKICEVFEFLRVKVITSSITTLSDRILKTVFIEAGEEENDSLKGRIESAIAILNGPESPMMC